MAAKEYEIAFKIAGRLEGGFQQSFKAAGKAVSDMGLDLGKLNQKAAQVDKLVRLKKEVGQSARAYTQAKQKVGELGRAISQTSNPTKAQVAEFNKAKTAVTKAKEALEKKRSTLKSYEQAVGSTDDDLQTLIKRQKELADATDKARAAQERMSKINSKLGKVQGAQDKLSSMKSSSAGALAGIGAGVAATLGVPVKEAMAMEDAMAEVKKVVDFDTPDGLTNLQQQLEDMSLRIPMSADGLAQIAAAAGQSGIAAKDLATFTEQAAKMGVAFDISAEEAGTMMAKWQSGMGLTQKQTFELADATNALSNSNAASASQIGEVLQRYGALGKVAGLSEKQTAAFAASVVASGAESEVAATGIKAFMRALGKGGSMSKSQADAFEKVGLDPAKLQKQLQKDAPKTIISTLDAIKKNVPKEKWNEYLSAMFGEEAAVAVGPMMQNLDSLKNNFKLVGDSASYSGSMLAEFKSRSATTSNALTLMKNAAMYAARAVGAPLLEPIRSLSTEFVSIAQKAANWIKQNQDLVMSIMKGAGAVVGAVSAFHALRLAFAFLASPILSVYKGYLNVKKAIEWCRNSTMLQTAATKAAALAQRAWSAAVNVGKFIAQKAVLLANKAAVLGHTIAVKAAALAQKAWNGAVNVAKFVAQKAALLANKAAVLGHTIAVKAAALAQRAWSAAVNVGKFIAQKAALIATKAATVAHTVAMRAAAVAQRLWSASISVAKLIAQKVALVASKVAMLAWSAACKVAAVAQKALSAAIGFMSSPIGIAIVAITALIAIGIALYRNWDKVKAKCVELWQAFASKFPGIASIVQGAFNLMKPVINGLKTMLGGIIDFICGVFTGNWRRAWEGIKDIFGGAWEALKGLAQAPLRAVIGLVNKAIGALNGLNIKIPDWVPGKYGGKTFSLNIPTIPGLAEGGIVTQPTLAMIGEGRESEAVLPLSKLDSMMSPRGEKGGAVTVNYSPVINIGGGSAEGVYEQAGKALDESLAAFERKYERMLNQRRRCSYA